MISKRRVWMFVAAFLTILTLGAMTLALRIPFTSETLRQGVVELGALTLRVLPALHVDGTDLRIRHKGRRDVPPLISIDRFTVDANLLGLWRNRVAQVNLKGLDIQIPPHHQGPDDDHKSDGRVQDGDTDANDVDPTERDIVIDELVADEATLTILPRTAGKRPKVWHMQRLHMQSVGGLTKMPFRTVMTNAVPPGQIATTGSFGPWNRVVPGLTPLDGTFTFENGDLGVFKGISGILTAHGSYSGKLEGVRGRLVTLDIDMPSGRLEDIMRMAVRTSQPPMTGGLRLRMTFDLPPGDTDVVDKLKLDGAFTIDDGRFTNAAVQEKINALSRRASAKQPEAALQTVASHFNGRFELADGQLALSTLTFNVPGAIVELSGQYSLTREVLAFNGSLFMDAKVSQTTTGWKSLMLKGVDPLFRKDGRTVIPIQISGTRNEPSFGMDVRRVFRRGDSEP